MLLKTIMDEIDKEIIAILQKDPGITHSQIAKQLNRSQPAVGARIKKLSELGILATQVGVDFSKVTDFNLVKVEIVCSKPELIMDMPTFCPYAIQALKISGNFNILLFMACSSLKRLDIIIDRHFRTKEWISNIKMDLITQFAKPFVLPIDFNVENFNNPSDPCADCKTCKLELNSLLENEPIKAKN